MTETVREFSNDRYLVLTFTTLRAYYGEFVCLDAKGKNALRPGRLADLGALEPATLF